MNYLRRIKLLINKIGMLYVGLLCKREYKTQCFRNINERPLELAFVFKQLSRTWPTSVLDVGTGVTALPHLMSTCGFVVTAMDNVKDYWPFGMTNRHYHVINDNITDPMLQQTFDFISCISVLEHIKNHRAAVKGMFSLLNPGGYLAMSFPYHDEYYQQNVYELPDSAVKDSLPFITQSFSRKELERWLIENNGELMEQEYWQFFSGTYWACGDYIVPPKRVERYENHQLSCVLIRKANEFRMESKP
jgi:2-polyprenyl-3-methyl-5-hydroxy-6-metoxy-1,4-benzoquinol methylase